MTDQRARAQAMTREQVEAQVQQLWDLNDQASGTALLDHDAAQRETIRRLEGELESQSWKISPAMAQAKIDEQNQQLAKAALHIEQLQARLTASEAAKKWTTARPTVAGWYWWRKGSGYSNDMVAIFYEEPHSEWKARFLGLKGGKIGTLPVNVCDGEWQGPLTPGEE